MYVVLVTQHEGMVYVVLVTQHVGMVYVVLVTQHVDMVYVVSVTQYVGMVYVVLVTYHEDMMYVAGTSPQGVDIQDYVDVGVTNMAVAKSLTLHDGQTYYITVRGEWSVFVASHLCGQ